jgi:hypothetical protein
MATTDQRKATADDSRDGAETKRGCAVPAVVAQRPGCLCRQGVRGDVPGKAGDSKAQGLYPVGILKSVHFAETLVGRTRPKGR